MAAFQIVTARALDPRRQSRVLDPRTYLRAVARAVELSSRLLPARAPWPVWEWLVPNDVHMSCGSTCHEYVVVLNDDTTDLQAELFGTSNESSPRSVRRRVRAYRSHAPAVSRPTRMCSGWW